MKLSRHSSMEVLRVHHRNTLQMTENDKHCTVETSAAKPIDEQEPPLPKTEHKRNSTMINADTIPANLYRSAISRRVTDITPGKKAIMKQYLPLALAMSFEVTGCVLTWISLNDARIALCCVIAMLSFIGCVLWKKWANAENLLHAFAVYCALLVMLSLLAGWTVERIEPSYSAIASAALSLTGAGYFIYKPRMIN
jgi:drug/metabolite transporter superfamily protein YnfA